jgi:hypothetical protein
MVRIVEQSEEERRVRQKELRLYEIARNKFGEDRVSKPNKIQGIAIRNPDTTSLDNLTSMVILAQYNHINVYMPRAFESAVELAKEYGANDFGEFKVKIDY